MPEPLLPLPPALDQLLVARRWLELTLARVDEKISVVRAAEEERARRRPLPQPPDWWIEYGTTIRQLVEDLAEGRPTQAEYAERAGQARAELASVLGTVPSEAAEAKARGLLERLGARQDPAAA
ncbi:hypothetical protein ACIRBY_25090 [Streptomyces sp. NPDC096136]|uniref:hypothetical protein n=1 Tax=Streptomyces sp. NPDC096136 TaxID=3366076 RepID=UPI00381200C2